MVNLSGFHIFWPLDDLVHPKVGWSRQWLLYLRRNSHLAEITRNSAK